jgi:hypothetical protein
MDMYILLAFAPAPRVPAALVPLRAHAPNVPTSPRPPIGTSVDDTQGGKRRKLVFILRSPCFLVLFLVLLVGGHVGRVTKWCFLLIFCFLCPYKL